MGMQGVLRWGLGLHRSHSNTPFSPRAVSPPWPVPWWSMLPSLPHTRNPNNSCSTLVSSGGGSAMGTP